MQKDLELSKAQRDKLDKLSGDLDQQRKKSFEESHLVENYAAVIDEVIRAKPAAAKGRYLKSITLSTTMGPGIRIDPTRAKDIEEVRA